MFQGRPVLDALDVCLREMGFVECVRVFCVSRSGVVSGLCFTPFPEGASQIPPEG